MSTFVSIAGWLCIAGLCIGFAGLRVFLAIDAADRILDRLADKWKMQERMAIRQMLACSAWWFSEDEATMKLLQAISNDPYMANLGGIREEWRKNRKETPDA